MDHGSPMPILNGQIVINTRNDYLCSLFIKTTFPLALNQKKDKDNWSVPQTINKNKNKENLLRNVNVKRESVTTWCVHIKKKKSTCINKYQHGNI